MVPVRLSSRKSHGLRQLQRRKHIGLQSSVLAIEMATIPRRYAQNDRPHAVADSWISIVHVLNGGTEASASQLGSSDHTFPAIALAAGARGRLTKLIPLNFSRGCLRQLAVALDPLRTLVRRQSRSQMPANGFAEA